MRLIGNGFQTGFRNRERNSSSTYNFDAFAARYQFHTLRIALDVVVNVLRESRSAVSWVDRQAVAFGEALQQCFSAFAQVLLVLRHVVRSDDIQRFLIGKGIDVVA